jgi:uracil-DNA glycosylase family 4
MPQVKQREHCWRGKDDPAPYIPGLPAEVPRARALKQLYGEMVCCTRCELAEGRTQVVIGTGAARARVMLIGEGPGAKEDDAGVPFVGSAGKLLDRLLAEGGIARDDVFITNVVACRPPGNRAPKPREVAAHSPWLEEQIRLVNPEFIGTLGRSALIYFFPKARITEIHGQQMSVERDGRNIVLIPMFHPAAALRGRELIPVLEEDFRGLGQLVARKDGG